VPSPHRTLRGPAVSPRAAAPSPAAAALERWDDALIEIDAHGMITAIGPAPADCPIPTTHPGCVLLPGLVDTHLHFPQTRVIGSASGPLLEWLERSVFPEEARFAEVAYATEVAREFCDALVAQGTTCAAIYGSSHPVASAVLFAELERRGLRATLGPALMDRNAPDDVLLEASAALDACAALVERWHGCDRGRLRVSIVPRFALSCTTPLMRGAADLAARHGLWIQTHIAENHGEIAATAAAFPDARDYLAVYEEHGLLGERTILAHCIWLSESEWDRVASADASVAHCPDSNFFLGSGRMALGHAARRGIRVGLGTDIGAGRSFSVRRIAASAYDNALVVGDPVDAERLLWLATTGGAQALGLGDVIGRLAPGFDADIIAVQRPRVDDAGLVDALLFRHDAPPVAATYVRGTALA
jgi:guanine deaminase